MIENAIRSAVVWVVFAAAFGGSLAAQDKPDFSGSWSLESKVNGADIPQALSVTQTVVRANVRGEPMTPFYKDLTVRRVFASGPQVEAYVIGTLSGTVAGQVGGDLNRLRTHRRVAWEEQTLVIDSGSYTGAAPETGDWTERRERWALDSGGRLRVTVTTRSSGSVPITIDLIYRRQ